MKIRRFVARDMRTALEQIKEELGADAVIMSNKKIPEGVELMAAVDYNHSTPEEQSTEALNSEESVTRTKTSSQRQEPSIAHKDMADIANREITADKVTLGQVPITEKTGNESDSLSALLQRKVQQASIEQQQQVSLQGHNSQASEQNTLSSDDIEQQFKDFTNRLQHGVASVPTSVVEPNGENQQQATDNEFADNTATRSLNENACSSNNKSYSQEGELAIMKKEMASIRELLEHQVSGLMWQDMAQKDPARMLLIDKLTALGLNEQVADQISGYVPSNLNEEDSWNSALSLMASQINTTNNDIVHRGGVVALVGPTGVGKTTTIAKLAARFAQIHGVDSVAMISTDNFRIAGYEQLATYGRIIGCQVKLAQDDSTLDSLLQQLSHKKLVLIDTAGMGQRDMRLAEQLTTLISNARIKIRNYLVLSANTQQRVMQENVERFKKVPLAGCIFTKLDESLSVGEIISTSIQNGLPIGYLTDGQRVPEDIKVANAEKLVTLADKMSSKLIASNSATFNHINAHSACI